MAAPLHRSVLGIRTKRRQTGEYTLVVVGWLGFAHPNAHVLQPQSGLAITWQRLQPTGDMCSGTGDNGLLRQYARQVPTDIYCCRFPWPPPAHPSPHARQVLQEVERLEPPSCDTDRRLVDKFVSSLRAQFMAAIAPPSSATLTATEIRSEVSLWIHCWQRKQHHPCQSQPMLTFQVLSAIRAQRRRRQLMAALLQNLDTKGWREREVQQRAIDQLDTVFRTQVDTLKCRWGRPHVSVYASVPPGQL